MRRYQYFYINILYFSALLNTVLLQKEEVYVRTGAQYVFKCPYRKETSNNLIWGYTNNLGTYFQISDGTYVSTQYPGRDRVTIVGDNSTGEYNLQLSGIQESDEGEYVCSVNNGGSGGSQKGNFSLYIKVPPTNLTLYNITDNHIIGTEGQSLTLNCTATGGKPPPEIRLTVSGTTTTGIQTVVYTISVLKRSHDKQSVTCQANSTALDSPLSKSTSLYLYLKPSIPTFSQDQPTANETQQLILSCTSVGSRPAVVLYWKLKGALVTSGITSQDTPNTSTDTYTVTSTLTHDVNRSYNGQPITCGVTHLTITGSLETTKTLSVQYVPDIVIENITFVQQDTLRTLRCNASGNPTTYTYYRWQHMSKYGELIRELDGGQNGVLTLPEVPESQRYQDTGEYRCTVSNGIGDTNGVLKQSGSGYMTVRAQPVFTLNNNGMDIQYGEIGKDRNIHVFVYSLPKYTTLNWFKGNQRIITSSKYNLSEIPMVVQDNFNTTKVNLDGYSLTLTISNLQNEDFDNYIVQLYNGYGENVQRKVIIKFGSAPDTPANFSVTETTKSSIKVQWNPGFGGGLLQTIYLQYRQIGSEVWLSGGMFNVSKLVQHSYTLTSLQEGTEFELRMFAKNIFNQSMPTDIEKARTKSIDSSFPLSAIGGIVGGGIALCVIIVVIAVMLRKRKGSSKDSNLYDSDTDELKDNILYGTKPEIQSLDNAGEHKSNTEYAEVQNSSAVYAEVHKTEKSHVTDKKKKAKSGNLKKTGKHTKATKTNDDSEYSNAGLALNVTDYGNTEQKNGNKNADGLQYADLSFTNIHKKGKQVIHGQEDRTVYASVDHTKTAPPLPQESEYEETNISQRKAT